MSAGYRLLALSLHGTPAACGEVADLMRELDTGSSITCRSLTKVEERVEIGRVVFILQFKELKVKLETLTRNARTGEGYRINENRPGVGYEGVQTGYVCFICMSCFVFCL